MRVYLGNDSTQREIMKGVAKRFQEAGHTITSRWILDDEFFGKHDRDNAVGDLKDLEESDVLVLFAHSAERFGKWIEFGYALRAGTTVIVIGEPDYNLVFLKLPNLRKADCTRDAIKLLGGVGK